MIEEAGEIGVDSLILNPPATVQSAIEPLFDGRRSIDMEPLLWWTMDQTGYLPWRGVSPRELMFDHGYTVLPKGCSREYRGGETLLRRPINDDAAAIIAAIMALDGGIAGVVIRCARERTRPDWMEGVEPRRVERWKRHRKKHRRVLAGYQWEPCSLDTIRAARELYERWHDVLSALAGGLLGQLNGWKIKGFSAPKHPWES